MDPHHGKWQLTKILSFLGIVHIVQKSVKILKYVSLDDTSMVRNLELMEAFNSAKNTEKIFAVFFFANLPSRYLQKIHRSVW